MPIHYAILPELDLLLYIFRDEFSATDYFRMYDAVYLDERRHHGMKIIMDLRHGILNHDAEDFKAAVEIVRVNHEQGFAPDHVALVTHSSLMKHLTDAIILLADELPMHLSVFHNQHDAIRWLGLSANEADVMQFWEEAAAEKV